MNRLFLTALLLFVASCTVYWTWQESSSTPQDSPRAQAPQDEDSMSRRDFMRTKLMYSQNIFEGLTTDNFPAIEQAIGNLQLVTDGAQWVAIENEEYDRLTTEFKSALTRSQEAAQTENIDATALRFYQVSTSCFDCHQHLRQAKYDL